jgi:phthalate 4,5-dioxygenase
MSIEKNDLMHVGPGTLMGKFMREYWLPGLVSTELVADGDPVRFKLLGEHLIAFRDSSGKVGVLDHRCPHRCASLFLGRNEQNGLRCVYHGWKFDTDGNCVDQPNVPVAWQAKQKVRAKAYRVQERGGVVWVYMGESQQSPPPLPQLEILLAPDHEIGVQFVHRSCNYLQSLEGDIDTSHFGFLHAAQAMALIGTAKAGGRIGGSPTSFSRSGRSSRRVSSAKTFMSAVGCRSTTTTACG